jgi:hypothetical protein
MRKDESLKHGEPKRRGAARGGETRLRDTVTVAMSIDLVRYADTLENEKG